MTFRTGLRRCSRNGTAAGIAGISGIRSRTITSDDLLKERPRERGTRREQQKKRCSKVEKVMLEKKGNSDSEGLKVYGLRGFETSTPSCDTASPAGSVGARIRAAAAG